jgi:putative flippase GtrA
MVFVRNKIFRYVLAGIVATGFSFGVFILCTSWFSWWYMYATVLSYLVGFGLSFTLQKYWTFQDHTQHLLLRQGAVYTLLAVANFFLYGGLIYVLVEYGNFLPVTSQVMASIVIAVEAYVISSLIFTP